MAEPALDQDAIATLEAFADTIIPGERRGPDDRAIAGVAPGGGAVAAGALELLAWDATGITGWLPDLPARRRRPLAVPRLRLRPSPRFPAPVHHALREPGMTVESTDILVIGSGFGGAITAYHLAAGGAKVVILERGPWLTSKDFDHDF